jgi:hypothetical protein
MTTSLLHLTMECRDLPANDLSRSLVALDQNNTIIALIELASRAGWLAACFRTLSVSRAASRRYEAMVATALYHRFLERIVARVPVAALLQRGYTVRDNAREPPDKA